MNRARVAPLLLAAFALCPSLASAHATLVKSSPARKATLAEPPARVELIFSERLEAAYARLRVEDASGARVNLGDVSVARDDGRRLTVSLPPLPAGAYTIHFRVVSVDGHVVESSLPFAVKPRR